VNAIQLKHGPFAEPVPKAWGLNMTHMAVSDVEGRNRRVKESTDAEWLAAVIAHHDTQKTVRVCAERRLKQVNKKGQL